MRLYGDPHLDAQTHARDLLVRDLKQGREDNDIGVFMGDHWSAILPRDLKRYTSGRNGRKRDAIINDYIDLAYEVYKPYVNTIDVMLLGNHETAVLKNHHVDILGMLIDRLNQIKTDGAYRDENGKPMIVHAGYTCYVQVQFIYDAKGKRSGSVSNSVWLHHGRGGGAPVTKGVIDFNRIANARFADVYAIGHKHTAPDDQDRFEWMDPYGNIRVVWRDFMVVPGYSGEGIYDDDYGQSGYVLDYSEENHYGLEAQGSKRILFQPMLKRRSGSSYPHIKRTITKETH
jgi:hypothetical protein